MNDAQLLSKLAAADAYEAESPLPESIWTSDLALREIERRTDMRAQETDVATESPSRGPRGWVVAVIAFAAVLVIGAVVMVSAGGSDISPAVSPTTVQAPTTTLAPTTTAPVPTTSQAVQSAAVGALEEWALALSAGDADGAIALLDPSEDGMVAVVEFFAEYAAIQRIEDDCTENEFGGVIRVSCTLVVNEPIMNVLGLDRMKMVVEYTENGLVFRDFGDRMQALQNFSRYARTYQSEAFDEVCNPDTVDASGWVESGHVLTAPCGELYAELARDVAFWIAADRPMP